MDNAQKAIMIGVGLFITIIIISVVLLITNLGTGMVDDARGNLGNMSASLQNSLKTTYDKKTVTGLDVQNLYRQYKDNTDVLLVIQANDKKHYAREAETKIGFNSSQKIFQITPVPVGEAGHYGRTLAFSAVSGSFTNYINKSARYNTYVIKDMTDKDMIVGIYCRLAE